MDSKNEYYLNEEIKKLEILDGLIGVAIVKLNGMLITSTLPLEIDERKFGAMIATMFSAIETATISFNQKKIFYLTVEFNDYNIIALKINNQIIIVSLLEKDMDLGLTLIELEEKIKDINNLLNG